MKHGALIVSLSLILAGVAGATQRTFTYTAVLDSSNDPAGAWSTADKIYAVLSYDDTAADSNANMDLGDYRYDPLVAPNGLWVDAADGVVGATFMSIVVDNESSLDSVRVFATPDIPAMSGYLNPFVELFCYGPQSTFGSDALPTDIALASFSNGCSLTLSYVDDVMMDPILTEYTVTAIAAGDRRPQPCFLIAWDGSSHTLECGDQTITVSSASNTLFHVAAEAAGTNCAAGGQRIDLGLDNGDGDGAANDGALQSGEIDSTVYVCNGATGAAGATGATGTAGAAGTAGADGASSLIDQEQLAAGAECPDGGYRLYVGIDDNGDGTLAAGERDSTLTICNGSAGADGASGADGTPGANACRTMPASSVGFIALALLLMRLRRCARAG